MTNQERRGDYQNGGTMQKLLTSVAVIENSMESLEKLIILRFDNVDKNGVREQTAIATNATDIGTNKEGINQNKISIARVATWTTIIGTVIIIASAISNLLG